MTTSQRAFAGRQFSISPPQSWVRTIDSDSGSGAAQASDSSSLFLLDDHQTRVSEKTVDRYYHHVQKVQTSAGLDDLSQLRFYFEPSYQQLAIHFIRIHRGNAVIASLNPSDIKVIQQEEELDQQLYNGTLAAVVFVHDLRVGDTVDYAYTVSGENPVLGGRFADTFSVGERLSIQHFIHRLVWPSNRSLSMKNENTEIAPITHDAEGSTEYVWEQHNTKAITVDDATPGWFSPYPVVRLSEFKTWSEVVQWALPLYVPRNLQAPELVSKIKQWQAETNSPEEQTVLALRFVQDEIRYLGIELDRYSHQPSLPERVFARRFGDCKDKSFLLSTILRSMGIDAAPALVHSTSGRSLDNQQPSPFAFDHVIVQAKLGGKTYWLDPTISYQRGGLDKYYDPTYERALVLREGSSELEKIPLPAPGSGSVTVKERYQGAKTLAPVTLSVSTTYAGAEADSMRYQLATETLAELSKGYLNYYADENPGIRADGLPQIEDDQGNNRIVVNEKYLIDDFWRVDEHRFVAEKIYVEVGKPAVSQRSMPLRLRYPLSIKHTIEINLSVHYAVDPASDSFEDEAMKFSYSYSSTGNLIRLEYSLNTLADSIPLEKISRHLVVLDQIQAVVGFRLSTANHLSEDTVGSVAAGLLILGVIIIGLPVGIAITVLRRRQTEKRRLRFVGELKARAGFAPETAIVVPTENDIDGVLRAFKCGCGQLPYRAESPPQRERFSYDGQRLVSVRLHCNDCKRNNDLYLKFTSTTSS